MPIPFLPLVGAAWKIINVGGNIIFLGQLGAIAIKKYKQLKTEGFSDKEIFSREDFKKFVSGQYIKDVFKNK